MESPTPSTPSEGQVAPTTKRTRSCEIFVAMHYYEDGKLVLTETYRACRGITGPACIPPTWLMRKLTDSGSVSDVYTIHRDEWGLHCTCGDGTHRRENEQKKCKHAEALASLGLIGGRE